MSIVGIGTDIIEIQRVASAIKKQPRFLERLFTEEERAYLRSKANAAQTAAGLFAAKEAVAKALGTGFRGMSFRQIRIAHSADGQPLAAVDGREGLTVLLSISHCKNYATAYALAYREE